MPRDGKSIAADFTALINYVRASRIVSVKGGRLKETPNGTTLEMIESPAAASGSSPIPLYIIAGRPPYIAAPVSDPAVGYTRIWIEWGTLNEQLATNWNSYFDVAATTYFFAKATLRTTSTIQVTSWEILTGAAVDTYETADWAVGAARPSSAVHLLGSANFLSGSFVGITNSGGGSLALTEHLTHIEAGSGAGDVSLGRQLNFSRQNY